jgi:DNA-binding CsgD family transcriptional regulator
VTGLEPGTSTVSWWRSNQLSYTPVQRWMNVPPPTPEQHPQPVHHLTEPHLTTRVQRGSSIHQVGQTHRERDGRQAHRQRHPDLPPGSRSGGHSDRHLHRTGADREFEVLRLIAEGLSNAEIATRLHLGEATVRTHVSNPLLKLHLRDRVKLVVYTFEHGIVGRRRVGEA